MTQSQHLSLFDLDHTLVKVNTSFHFGIYLHRHKFYSRRALPYILSCYGLHKMGVISIKSVHQQIFKTIFQGRSANEIETLAYAFLEEHFERLLYPAAIQKLRQAQQENHYTVILSSAPNFLVSEIARRLEVSAWDSTQYHVDNWGRLASISRFLLSEEKAEYTQALAKRLKIPKQQTTAYSDSYLDYSFLQSAGTAVAVNPDSKLHALAKKNGWQII